MLIWIASYPRSGNTFFRHVLAQLYGVASFERYSWGPDHMPLQLSGFEDLGERSLAEMSAAHAPYFVKTHDLPDDDNPAIYLVRDGRDALISHAHFILEYDRKVENQGPELFHDALRMLIETDSSFAGWSGNVQAWTGRSAPTAIVRFEDLVSDPLNSVRRAVGEIGFRSPEAAAAEPLTFDELNRAHPEFFRRGKIGAWREEMPHDLHEVFWRRHGETMRLLDYRRPVLRMFWRSAFRRLRSFAARTR
jgi:hypothetical protein